MFMFVKMSSGWFATEVQSIFSSNAMEHIRQGEIVAFADSVDDFCYEMELDESEVQVVQPA